MFSASDKIYEITFIDAANVSTTIQVGSEEYILESAEDQGVKLPGSCYAGKCITCAGRLLKGEVEQDQVFLKPEEMAAGFVLVCRSYPRSDCVILTHQEDALLNLNP
jgi:ferredoxin